MTPVLVGLIGASVLCIAPGSRLLIDKEKASVSLELERIERPGGKVGEAASVVWLKLHNNMRSPVRVKTTSMYLGQKAAELTLKDGKNVLGVKPGVSVSPCYFVEALPAETASIDQEGGINVTAQTYQRLPLGPGCETGSITWIPAGGEVRFAVPEDHLKTLYRIVVPFDYEWDDGAKIEHRVMFWGVDLR
jgi:hypothetical protein